MNGWMNKRRERKERKKTKKGIGTDGGSNCLLALLGWVQAKFTVYAPMHELDVVFQRMSIHYTFVCCVAVWLGAKR